MVKPEITASKRLFCTKPFTWFEVSRWDREGEVFVCCPGWMTSGIGNLLDSTVAEVWNGDRAQDIRRSILDGSFEYCIEARCPFLQSKSGPVQLVDDVKDALMRQAIDQNLTLLPWGPQEINASYDRSCNLSCPSCRTEVIMEHARKNEILSIQTKLTNEALGEAKFLYITGSGDPFGSPYFREWLTSMRLSDMPQLEKIYLHTNGLLWTQRNWERIHPEIRARVLEAHVSIDAASPGTYAINRRGGDFERLLRNLEFVARDLRPSPLLWLGVSMVVQENNFEEMADFVRLGQRFGVNGVYFSQIVNWGTFSDEEFSKRAIHLPEHPRHGELIEALRNPILDSPEVYIGNLSYLR
jgi:hypothetical protein